MKKTRDITRFIAQKTFENQTFFLGYDFKQDYFFKDRQGKERRLTCIIWSDLPFSDSEYLKKVSGYFAKIVRKKKIQVIVGAEVSGIIYAALIAHLTKARFAFCRKERKQHGTKKAIEGQFKKGMRAVLVDNFIYTGRMACKMIKFMREEGLKVNDLFVIEDFTGMKKDPYLMKEKIQIHSASTSIERRELLNKLGYFTRDLYQHIKDYDENPFGYYVGSPKYKQYLAVLRKAPNRKYIIKPIR